MDAIKYFREIPETSSCDVISGIELILKTMPDKEKEQLAELALLYPQYVIALLGALLERCGWVEENLKSALNGLTVYRLNIPESFLPTKSNWNIL